MPSTVSIEVLKPAIQDDKAHHVDHPPTAFCNPWPSARKESPGLLQILSMRFGSHPEKTNIPTPEDVNGARSEELVKVRTPDWGESSKHSLRATWLGHASFLVETPIQGDASRGVRILFDPVFAERMSSISFAGPKRFTPTPCTLEELPEIDLICISHNHYDHFDLDAISKIYAKNRGNIKIFTGLNNARYLSNIQAEMEDMQELDWWDRVKIDFETLGSSIKLSCCPAQHGSRRTIFDGNAGLWCSWAVEAGGKKLFFAGDTGYQAVDAPSPCPAFKQIGDSLGSFDLALLPIGCFRPAAFMAEVHASPAQSLEIHKDIKSKLSIGMHYMTIRGALSKAFEAVQDPARQWREFAEKEGLWCGGGIEGDGKSLVPREGGVGLCDVGETIAV